MKAQEIFENKELYAYTNDGNTYLKDKHSAFKIILNQNTTETDRAPYTLSREIQQEMGVAASNAINETYGRGIDPAIVPEILHLLKRFVSYAAGMSKFGRLGEINNIYKEAKDLIEKSPLIP